MKVSIQPLFHQRIGEVLVEADLLTAAQVQVALYDQQQFSTMRLGEILVFRGWLNQQTADFFGEHWVRICAQDERQSLGDYLCAAGLMDRNCIEKIVEEQGRNGYRFGANAVLLGFIQQKTLNYFLEKLFPEEKNQAPYVFNGKQRIMQPQSQVAAEISQGFSAIPNTQQASPESSSLDEDISWVG